MDPRTQTARTPPNGEEPWIQFFPLIKYLPVLRYVGTAYIVPGGHYRNSHVALEVFCVESGAGCLTQGRNGSVSFRRGDVLLIAPKYRFEIKADASDRVRLRYLGMDIGALREKRRTTAEEGQILALCETLRAHGCGVAWRDDANIGLLLRHLCMEIKAKPVGYEVLAKAYCLEILSLLARAIQQRAPGRHGELSGRHRRLAADAIAFIHKNCTHDLSLAQVAGSVFLSPHHFSRLFRSQTGYPPMQYVIRCRIDKAKDLLANEELSCTEIAEQAGFSDPFHFSATFKKVAGLSPMQYRRLLR